MGVRFTNIMREIFRDLYEGGASKEQLLEYFGIPKGSFPSRKKGLNDKMRKQRVQQIELGMLGKYVFTKPYADGGKYKREKMESEVITVEAEVMPEEIPAHIQIKDKAELDSNADLRLALINQDQYKFEMTNKMSNISRRVMDSIGEEDLEEATLRDKAYTMDLMNKNARLLAGQSTENIAHGVGNLQSILYNATDIAMKKRFDK